ncbi:MAG: hypothetical protein K5770_10030 [Lachnospiraceae bacterium]|nr:hypothetical protein [Lachnospiraceae bacterium]
MDSIRNIRNNCYTEQNRRNEKRTQTVNTYYCVSSGFSAVVEPVRTRADFGNFAGDSDYGGGGSSRGGGGDGFLGDLEFEVIAWAIAVAIVVLLVVWVIL